MTEKQKRFSDEYLIDLNATQAAIRAGYSSKTAYSIGNELLNKPEIRTRVDTAMAERSKRTGVNADRVVRELARIAFVNAPDVVDTKDATVKADASEDDTAAIASVKVKITDGDYSSIEREVKFADKIKALELIGRHLGVFNDKLQIDSNIAVQILDNVPRGDDNG
ncbi:MAG: terminase small subunit [Lachnospiraceae bacterium]|nr:terminase small subunit [Lachnospiraceae bacterium]